MAVRKNCEDCHAPIDRPRVRFCPACVQAHKRLQQARRSASKTRCTGHTHPEKIYKVVACPDDEWPCNCQLVKTDVEITLKTGHFPPGMIFEQAGRRLRVCGSLFTKQYLVEVW